LQGVVLPASEEAFVQQNFCLLTVWRVDMPQMWILMDNSFKS